jgi:hypothetical protein
MKTPFKNWDEKLRERLGELESPVSDDLFNAAMKKREQRKWLVALRKKSRGLWLLLLLLVPFTCTYLKNNTTPAIENAVNNREQITTDTKLSYPTGSNSNTTNNQPATAGNIESAQRLNNAEKNKVRKKESNKQPSEKATASKKQVTPDISNEINYSGSFKNTSNNSNEIPATFATPAEPQTMLNVQVSNSGGITNLKTQAAGQNAEIFSISSLPVKSNYLFKENYATSLKKSTRITPSSNNVIDSTAAIEISPTSWGLHGSVEGFFSPDLAFQQLTDIAGDSLTLTNWNKRMEKSFTAGLRFALNFDGGMFLKSGITYSKEQSSFTMQKAWKVPVILDSSYYYTIWSPFEDPQYVFFSDTIITSRDSMATYASSITYSYWNIPLLLGYAWKLNKFEIGIQSGVVINAKFTKQGSSIDPQTLEPVTMPENSASFFRNRASLSLYAGVINEYRFNKHIGIFAEPYFQWQLKPITTEAAPVEQRLHQFGLNTGIKYSF